MIRALAGALVAVAAVLVITACLVFLVTRAGHGVSGYGSWFSSYPPSAP
jgi:hypothetical protein